MVRSPYRNGRQEVPFARVGGRLMAIPGNVGTLTPRDLSDATITWAERGYHRRARREMGVTPLRHLTESGDASRPCPGR